MRRSWPTILIVLGVTIVLGVLGVLQYRWLTQISESDGEKARVRVKEQAERFAMDFNREIQNAYFNFQTGSESWRNQDPGPFNERYDYWHERTAYPELISGFYFFEARGEAAPVKYDAAERKFAPAEMTGELVDLKARFSDEKTFKAVYSEVPALVLPIHAHKENGPMRMLLRSPGPPAEITLPDKYGHLVIMLDPATLRERLLPELAAKYFGDGEYRAAVVNSSGESVFRFIDGTHADATAPLFDLSPENLIFYGTKDLMTSIGGEKGPDGAKRTDVVVNHQIESHSVNRVDVNGEKGAVKIEMKKQGMPRTSVFTATTKGGERPWTLQVQHSSGSIGAFLTSTLRRNLTLGFGLLFILAAAIGAVIFSAQRVRRLAQRQVDFVSSVSHEFRTPLAVIYSAGENLADGVAKDERQVARYGTLIKAEGKKLGGMVEQILNFAGANSGRRKYNFVEVSIDEVIAGAVDECRPLLDEKGIDIETHISTSLPSVKGDEAALSQAVQNLIINSIKYCNGEPWVRVGAENGGGNVKIEVEDRGIGISPGDLRQVFEPFYRSKSVVDAQIHGNGLGLSLVKQIAEAHGGRAFASSEIGKGSVFTIELPAL